MKHAILVLMLLLTCTATQAMERIHGFASVGALKFVKAELEKNPELLEAKDNEGSTPLICAAQAGKLDVVTYLLEAGANPKAVDKEGRNTLIVALKRVASPELVEVLIKSGANVNQQSSESTYLTTPLFSVRSGYSEKPAELQTQIVTLLLKAGADPAVMDISNKRPINAYSSAGMFGAIDALLAGGEDVDAPSKAGLSALYSAVVFKEKESVQYLIDKGASTEGLLKKAKDPEIKAILIKAGAK